MTCLWQSKPYENKCGLCFECTLVFFLNQDSIRVGIIKQISVDKINPTLNITSFSQTETLSQIAGISHIFCKNLHIHHQPKHLCFLVVNLLIVVVLFSTIYLP